MKKLMIIVTILPTIILSAYAYGQLSGLSDEGNKSLSWAKSEDDKADRELNFVYKLLKDLSDKEKQEKLIKAQLAWIKYRNLEAEFEISGYSVMGHSREEFLLMSKTQLTQERTDHMKKVIEELYEGGQHTDGKIALDKIRKWEAEHSKNAREEQEYKKTEQPSSGTEKKNTNPKSP